MYKVRCVLHIFSDSPRAIDWTRRSLGGSIRSEVQERLLCSQPIPAFNYKAHYLAVVHEIHLVSKRHNTEDCDDNSSRCQSN